jgi:hypothetical protein
VELLNARSTQSPAGVDWRIQGVLKSILSNETGLHDGAQNAEEPREENKPSSPIDLNAAVSEHPAVDSEEKQEAIESTHDESTSLADAYDRDLPPLPFQMLGMAKAKASKEVLKRARHGMMWVCFPASALEQNVKTYAPVFNEVARSQKWRMYPFVYLDTRRIERYFEHFCDDVEKITLVMEKRSDVLSDNTNTSSRPAPSKSGRKWVQFLVYESPEWFRRVLEPDQVIHAGMIEEFLNDIHSGKLPAIKIVKGDL